MPEEKPTDSDTLDWGHRRAGAWKGFIPALLLVAVGTGSFVIGYVASGPDVSASGQDSYACALAEKVRRTHRSEDDWGELGKDPGYVEISVVKTWLTGNPEDKRFAAVDWSAASEGPAAWGLMLDDVITACGGA